MANGFMLFADGQTLSVKNDSTTTAITAGDACYSIANDDKFGTTLTVASIAYAYDDVKVKAAHVAKTSYKTIMGVALSDIPKDGKGSIALEGVFAHKASANIEAGEHIQWNTTTSQQVSPIQDLGTTAVLGDGNYIIGKALTGATAEGKILLWKLTF